MLSSTDRGQPMQLFGKKKPFFPFDPRPEDIDLETIAHALSMQCRFGGHIKEFYSVAQHSVLVSLTCVHPKEGLLHDAAEAYLADVIRPLKVIFPAYKEAEEKIERAIAEKFGLIFPWPDDVKEADNVLLATEKRDLVVPNDQDWGPMPDPLPGTIRGWSAPVAKGQFLRRAKELGL